MFGITVKREKTERTKQAAQAQAVAAEILAIKTKADRDIEFVRQDVAKRVRVGHRNLDMVNLTAKARGEVESSILIEYDMEKIVVTARRHLTTAEINRLDDILGFTLNRT